LGKLQAPQRVEKPWGYEIWWAHTDSYAGKLLQVEQGHRLSLQYHQRKDESCYVLSGLVRLVKGPSVDELEEVDLGPGSCWRNQPGEIHTIEAIETSLVVEASTPQLDDVVRLLDNYGRAQDDIQARAQVTPPEPVRLLDTDQVAARLSMRRYELAEALNTDGFPQPTAYFRGRRLWEEASIAAWQRRPDEAPQEMRAAQAG
jgi:mannose-6-phosphate isomerase